jgi:hypothetical protein
VQGHGVEVTDEPGAQHGHLVLFHSCLLFRKVVLRS